MAKNNIRLVNIFKAYKCLLTNMSLHAPRFDDRLNCKVPLITKIAKNQCLVFVQLVANFGKKVKVPINVVQAG